MKEKKPLAIDSSTYLYSPWKNPEINSCSALKLIMICQIWCNRGSQSIQQIAIAVLPQIFVRDSCCIGSAMNFTSHLNFNGSKIYF